MPLSLPSLFRQKRKQPSVDDNRQRATRPSAAAPSSLSASYNGARTLHGSQASAQGPPEKNGTLMLVNNGSTITTKYALHPSVASGEVYKRLRTIDQLHETEKWIRYLARDNPVSDQSLSRGIAKFRQDRKLAKLRNDIDVHYYRAPTASVQAYEDPLAEALMKARLTLPSTRSIALSPEEMRSLYDHKLFFYHSMEGEPGSELSVRYAPRDDPETNEKLYQYATVFHTALKNDLFGQLDGKERGEEYDTKLLQIVEQQYGKLCYWPPQLREPGHTLFDLPVGKITALPSGSSAYRYTVAENPLPPYTAHGNTAPPESAQQPPPLGSWWPPVDSAVAAASAPNQRFVNPPSYVQGPQARLDTMSNDNTISQPWTYPQAPGATNSRAPTYPSSPHSNFQTSANLSRTQLSTTPAAAHTSNAAPQGLTRGSTGQAFPGD